MENILEEIVWILQENISRSGVVNNELRDSERAFSKCEEILTKQLKDEELCIFNKSLEAFRDITIYIANDNFINGMKVGAKMMLEFLR